MKYLFRILNLSGFLQALASLSSHQPIDDSLVSGTTSHPDLAPTQIHIDRGIATICLKPEAVARKKFVLRTLVGCDSNPFATIIRDCSKPVRRRQWQRVSMYS